MSLYLKYRPQDFSTVVGQDHVVKTLRNALSRKAVSHAYLFAGPRGTGKTSLARIIAKAINCLSPQAKNDPCNACSICTDINKGRLVDLIEIDAASNRGIDEIRELREKILFAPTHARAKVYIIDEVHMLTKEAFNALLKTLEEPPEHVYFVLATTEIHKIPETILSRCQQFTFKRIDVESIKKQLLKIAAFEKIEAEEPAVALIARLASGSLRDAIGLLEQMSLEGHLRYETVASHLGLSGSMLLESFFKSLLDKEARKALEIINQVNVQGQNLHQFTGEFVGFLREQMLINLEKPEELGFLIELIDVFSLAKIQINQALIPQLPLEMAVVKVCASSVKSPKIEARIPQSEKAEKKESQASEETEALELDLVGIKASWLRVAEAIETPFIRISFLDGEPVRFERGELQMTFHSKTLMEKVENKTNQAKIQEALKSVFNRKFKLKMELKKVNLKPIASAKISQPSLAEMAREVFGG